MATDEEYQNNSSERQRRTYLYRGLARDPEHLDIASGVGRDGEIGRLRVLATMQVFVSCTLDGGYVVDHANRAAD